MASPTPPATPPQPPSRLIHPDPTTNAMFQDVYNKLAQVQLALSKKKDA
jgi:hypothetical protein